MTKPSLSVVLVNWNHGHLLPACLDALLAQDYPSFDLTVVDNGSRDGSPSWLARVHPKVRLWAFDDNLGFSWAFNWAVDHTEAEWILSLNPDVILQPDFLSELVQAADCSPRTGMAAPKLLQAVDPALLDSTGLFIDRRRRPYDRGQGEVDRGQYDLCPGDAHQSCPLCFGGCGAAVLYRRAMLEALALDGEYFDRDFFAYYEDADLAWRAQLQGWRCVYVPSAVATHARGGGDRLRKAGRAGKSATGPRLALRNRYLMAIKNDTWHHFVADLPWILGAELPRLAYTAVTRPAVLLGLVDLAKALPKALRKRRQIQIRRTVDAAAVRRWFVAPSQMVAPRENEP